ncbi:MAG: ImmA/IrrE family metallo-endopeptidase [Sedimentibacter sp.]
MNLSKDLVPIIRKKEMDKEATNFLKKYCPEALEKPMAVPVEDIAEFKMHLGIDYVNINKNCDVLGMMIFSDGPVELYDKNIDKYIRRDYIKGTLLVEKDLSETSNRGRERFTIAHEMVHWDKHQLRFMALFYKDKITAKAYRSSQEKIYNPKTPEEWMEWQADNLAAAILMPADMFKLKSEELKIKQQASEEINGFMRRGFGSGNSRDFIIDELASTFQVSKQAAMIRINTLKINI